MGKGRVKGEGNGQEGCQKVKGRPTIAKLDLPPHDWEVKGDPSQTRKIVSRKKETVGKST